MPPPSQLSDDYQWVFRSHLSRHVRYLMAATGVPWRVLAHLAGVPSATVASMVTPGRRPRARIRAGDARRLLMLTPATVASAEQTLVPAAPTVNRIQTLHRAGHHHRQIAGYLNLSDHELAPLAAGEVSCCTLMVRLRAQAACEAHGLWWSEGDDPMA
ncbi:MAG: hypothetical protein LKI24_10525 [Acidipropionibacterium sp.]|nr:hypothetical protein [Acidipropionibacterium sp.]